MCATLALFGITAYEVLRGGGAFYVALCAALAGGVAGYFLFWRKNPVRWNAKEKLLEVERMTVVGLLAIAGFILLKTVLAVVLAKMLPPEAEAYLFAACFGFLAGRMLGMFKEIFRYR